MQKTQKEAFHQSGGGECFTAKCDEETFDRCPILVGDLVAILIGLATNNTYFLIQHELVGSIGVLYLPNFVRVAKDTFAV